MPMPWSTPIAGSEVAWRARLRPGRQRNHSPGQGGCHGRSAKPLIGESRRMARPRSTPTLTLPLDQARFGLRRLWLAGVTPSFLFIIGQCMVGNIYHGKLHGVFAWLGAPR